MASDNHGYPPQRTFSVKSWDEGFPKSGGNLFIYLFLRKFIEGLERLRICEFSVN